MKKKQLREKRRYLRLIIKNKIGVQNKTKGENKRVRAEVKNFSAEGLCFESKSKFRPGTKVGVELRFPAYKTALCLDGKITWSKALEKRRGKNAFNTGVKLLTIEKGDENRYIGYLCATMMQKFTNRSRA